MFTFQLLSSNLYQPIIKAYASYFISNVVRLAILMILAGGINVASAQTTNAYRVIGNPLGDHDTAAMATPKNHALYVEYRGTGGLYSVNYERSVSTNVNLRVGGAAIPHLNYSVVDEQLPEYRNALRDSSTTFVGLAMLSWVPKVYGVDVELSAGGVVTSHVKAFPTATVGLRLHPFSQNVLTRIGYAVSLPPGSTGPKGAFSVGVGVEF